MPQLYRALVQGWGLTCAVECAAAHREYFPARESDYGEALAALIRQGQSTTSEEYEQLENVRERFRAQLDAVLEQVDAVITPCMPCLAPELESLDARSAGRDEEQVEMITFTAPFDYSGHPTIAVPVGLAANGMPLVVQLVGRRLDEATLLQMGFALEQALGISLRPIA